MENIFYAFGIIYILNCIYNVCQVNSKNINVTMSTTIDEVSELKEDEDNKPFTIVTIITQLISVLGFVWFYMGTRLTDFIFFEIGFFTIIAYYLFVIIVGIIIGYNQTHTSNFTLYNAPEAKKTTIPLAEIVECIKIISTLIIVMNHFIFKFI